MDTINVALINTGDGETLTSGMKARTVAGQPNLVLTVVTPLAAILIRFGNNYLTMLVGLISAGMISDVLPAMEFWSLVRACAQLSIAGAGLNALKDIVTIFGKLEGRFPLSTGSV